ncbi:hypothetical protein [Streptomyces sp. VNUA24]|uniref:hypothetical protein n=1 Tax=Streptomyces sp. VNUA24 TaxID=3031131 RepID=UPI0023B7FC01|nr:hypothetical protein [Streptomyces sp. VNUA24]WEH16689.1 hypothetical protein PYR72_24425 [Streptomyces sp. VNUA24]
MKPWHLAHRMWTLLHDPKLRKPSTYRIARRNTTAIGRATSVIRLMCSVIVAGITWSVLGPQESAWWPAVTALSFVGSVLAIIHTREDIIGDMTQSRFLPVRLLGVELDRGGWQRLNLPAVLETLGPLAMAWMIGAPSGPFTDDPAAQLLAAAATLLYSGSGTLHWIIESVFYQPNPSEAWPVGFARSARAAVPVVLAVTYAVLLSGNSGETTATLPWLAVGFLLLHPVTVVYEKMLRSAVTEIMPAVVEQRLKDATVVHSSISNPLHYVLRAARNHPAGDAEDLIIYLRGELGRCLDELDHQHPAATVGEIIDGVRGSLLPGDRARLVPDPRQAPTRLGAIDASLARSVLADLCCNALKAEGDGNLPHATVATVYDDGMLTVRVTDDGPGMEDGWRPGGSLRRLGQLLTQLGGGLEFDTSPSAGTTVTASWALERVEAA